MCGIVGIVSKNIIKKSTLKNMNDLINHRGPNDEGFLFINKHDKDIDIENSIVVENNKSKSNFAFSHKRLSIVDTSSLGHQPMEYLDRYWIIYNGEIYNHVEIREDLKKEGYEFKSKTDTEMIMAAYDYWGVSCQNKFNGMWAFTLYDSKKDELFISRDRFGIKPLYYYSDENIFIFASEIKSILEHDDIKVKPNLDYLKKYLESGPNEYSKETSFQNIYRFPNSSYVKLSSEKLYSFFEIKKYWDFTSNTEIPKFSKDEAKKYAERYYELLKDSVRLRLRADVKVGSALSGGLDSSSIVYLINQILKEQGKEELQETFSCVYKTEGTTDCDESEYINLLAKSLNVNSNQIEPKIDNIIQEHSSLIYIMENPPESTCMSGWHTFKKVGSTNVTVTLDGQGADEQMAGYLMYLIPYFASQHLLNIYKEYKSFSIIPGTKKLIYQGIVINLTSKIIGRKNTTKLIKKIIGKDFTFNLNEQLKKDIMTRLLNLIHYSDRVSMGYSIESRMPFMDYRLVEFLASVPVTYKLHNGWTKYIARLAFDGKLPDEVTWRKDKMGWPIPENFWFRGKLRNWFKNEVDSSNFIKKLDKKLNIHEELDSNKHIVKLIRYLNIAVWYKTFFKEDKVKF